jgi:hypothetical protein
VSSYLDVHDFDDDIAVDVMKKKNEGTQTLVQK